MPIILFNEMLLSVGETSLPSEKYNAEPVFAILLTTVIFVMSTSDASIYIPPPLLEASFPIIKTYVKLLSLVFVSGILISTSEGLSSWLLLL